MLTHTEYDQVETLTETDVAEAVQAILDSEGVTLAQLIAQARSGRFATESQRRAWFSIDGLVAIE